MKYSDKNKLGRFAKLGAMLFALCFLLVLLMASQAEKLLKNQHGPCDLKFCSDDR